MLSAEEEALAVASRMHTPLPLVLPVVTTHFPRGPQAGGLVIVIWEFTPDAILCWYNWLSSAALQRYTYKLRKVRLGFGECPICVIRVLPPQP